MRCVEVARANVRDLRQEENDKGKLIWILHIQGKGRYSKDRAIGVTSKIVGPISEYIEEHMLQEDSPLFLNHSYISNNTRITEVTISKIVKQYLRAIGIDSKKMTAHSLRHTFAITAIKNGADRLSVQAALGHARVETTMTYQRAVEEERGREGTAIRLVDNVY